MEEKQNVVFILGAGCSQEDGAPLINDFFRVAFSGKIKKELTDKEKESFEDLKKFRERHLPNSNIEEFFSFIDLQSTINTINLDMGEINNKRNSLIHLISKTIQISLRGSGETLNKRFINKINQLSAIDRFSLITFNWDILLDNAIIRNPSGGAYQMDYGIDFFVIEDNNHTVLCNRKLDPLLYKLHGSLNWIKCSCKQKFFKFQDKIGIDYQGNISSDFVCPFQKRTNTHKLTPMLVPPTFSKMGDDSMNGIKYVWFWAWKELIKANKIIVIGYSLPETDTSFKLYFKSALISNILESTTKILKIDIVNYIPYSRNREIFEEKYKEIIEGVNNVEGVNNRIIINFIYKIFSDYVNDDLNLSTYTHNRIKNKTIG